MGTNGSRLVYLGILNKWKLSLDCLHFLKDGRLSVESNEREGDVEDLLERRGMK